MGDYFMDSIMFNGFMEMFKDDIAFYPRYMPGADILLKAQNVINRDGIDPDVYIDKPFLFTTQNQHYLEKTLPKEVNNAFVILGTGDTLFELVARDIKNITALENNDLQMLVFKLRLAAFKTLSAIDYERFLLDSGSHKFLSYDVFKTVKEALDDEADINTWDILLSRNPKEDLMYHLFKVIDYDLNANKSLITYLRSKKGYYAVREKLEKASINIVFGDALEYLEKNPEIKYDYIDITNILLFIFQILCNSNPNQFAMVVNRLKKIFEANLNPNGVMVLDYWFNHTLENLGVGFEIKNANGLTSSDIYKSIYDALNSGFDLEMFNIKAREEDTVFLTRKRGF